MDMSAPEIFLASCLQVTLLAPPPRQYRCATRGRKQLWKVWKDCFEEIRSIASAELKQVRHSIKELLRPTTARMTEDLFERDLIAEGIIAPLEKAENEYDFHIGKPIQSRW